MYYIYITLFWNFILYFNSATRVLRIPQNAEAFYIQPGVYICFVHILQVDLNTSAINEVYFEYLVLLHGLDSDFQDIIYSF